MSVYAPAANCAGVCVLLIVVLAQVPYRMMRPNVAAEQRAKPTTVEEPPVQPAKMMALLFVRAPAAALLRSVAAIDFRA